MAMNDAQACHVTQLTGNAQLLEPFRRRGLDAIGEELARMVLEAPDRGHPGDVVATNAWAEELELTGWFDWRLP